MINWDNYASKNYTLRVHKFCWSRQFLECIFSPWIRAAYWYLFLFSFTFMPYMNKSCVVIYNRGEQRLQLKWPRKQIYHCWQRKISCFKLEKKSQENELDTRLLIQYMTVKNAVISRGKIFEAKHFEFVLCMKKRPIVESPKYRYNLHIFVSIIGK